MKKIMALVLVVTVVFALCVPVMAVKSPKAEEYITVEVIKGEGDPVNGWKTDIVTIKEGETVTVTSSDKHGKFDNWTPYSFTTDSNGKRTYNVASYGKDYELVIDDVKIVEKLIKLNPEGAISVINAYPQIKKEVLKLDDSGDLNKIISSNAKKVAKLIFDNYDATLKLASKNSKALLAEKKLNILAHTDIVVAGNYNGKITNPYDYDENANKESDSPKTGDSSLYFVFVSILAMTGVCICSKKVFCK